VTVDPRETLEAEQRALEGRERLARGIGRFWIALVVAVAVGIVVLIVWFVA
jgi:hypothetical protein